MTKINAQEASSSSLPPPIVYTIAGSDSGGGAGIQADLHAIHGMNCHGCSAITCLTAQNSVGVTDVHTPPSEFLQCQLDTLSSDLPPRAIKIGMIGSPSVAQTVASFLRRMRDTTKEERPWVVLDPVMISTSGHALITDETKQLLISDVFPHCDVLTPNKFEAQVLLNRTLASVADVEQAAKDILEMWDVKAVLIKGGHSLGEDADNDAPKEEFAQDYFLSQPHDDDLSKERRLCDGAFGVWLQTPRLDSEHTHGTGCTLSSAMASALAWGHQARQLGGPGALTSMDAVDACCLAKAYVTAGIARGRGLGQGPGPVVHTSFPPLAEYFPTITSSRSQAPFLPMSAWDAAPSETPQLGRLLPIVDSVEWVQRLCDTPGITDIQLRIKDKNTNVSECVRECQHICESANVSLWINDYWREALEHNCFGVHLGQEDLCRCALEGGLEQLQQANMALGISVHSFGELAAALGVRPSYISLGPVFGTKSKSVAFDPQGLETVNLFRRLIPSSIPFVVIGGINDPSIVTSVRREGADCVAVIGAITKAQDTAQAVKDLSDAMN